ncbi:C40 family peptidase [Sporobacter termitidis]|nr:C40 family peptidase [Sporobacter termitidis]
MSVSLLGTPAEAVSKSQINALKQQQSQLAEQKASVQKQADALNSKVTSQTEKLNILTKQLNVTNSEIKNLSDQIAVYTNSVAEMENQLNENEQQQQILLEKYRKRIQNMEENGNSTYLGILFGATSVSDLLGRIDFVREIMEYDNGLIKDVQEAQVKVQNAKADMEAEMAEQEKVFASYKEKQADLLTQQNEVKAVLSSLTSDSADYQKQLSSLNTLQSSITGQISNMEKQLAEQQRIQAEQAAANKISSDKGNKWYGDSAGTGTGQDIVNYAKKFLGVPYVYGGTSPSGFDCSGLVYYCYKHFGYSVNRTASGLSFNGASVSSSSLQPGDVILFTAQSGGYIGHTGIYIGNGQFIHAPHTGDVVKISSLSESYYKNHYYSARRIIS